MSLPNNILANKQKSTNKQTKKPINGKWISVEI